MKIVEVYKFPTPVTSDNVEKAESEITPNYIKLRNNGIVPIFAPSLEETYYTVRESETGIVVTREHAKNIIKQIGNANVVKQREHVVHNNPLVTLQPYEAFWMLADHELTYQRNPHVETMIAGIIYYVGYENESRPLNSSPEPLVEA